MLTGPYFQMAVYRAVMGGQARGLIARNPTTKTCAVRTKPPDTRRERRTSGQLTAKPISIKDAKGRSGDCAQKAAKLTSGDLLRVAQATEGRKVV
jgi:hypothetical protein